MRIWTLDLLVFGVSLSNVVWMGGLVCYRTKEEKLIQMCDLT